MEGLLLGGTDEQNYTPAVGIRLNTASEKAYGGHKYHAQALRASIAVTRCSKWAQSSFRKFAQTFGKDGISHTTINISAAGRSGYAKLNRVN